jgi:hypothetical protein
VQVCDADRNLAYIFRSHEVNLMKTEDRIREEERQEVIRGIALIVTGGNVNFTAMSVCLSYLYRREKQELPGKFREINPHYIYRFSSYLTENNWYPLKIPSGSKSLGKLYFGGGGDGNHETNKCRMKFVHLPCS